MKSAAGRESGERTEATSRSQMSLLNRFAHVFLAFQSLLLTDSGMRRSVSSPDCSLAANDDHMSGALIKSTGRPGRLHNPSSRCSRGGGHLTKEAPRYLRWHVAAADRGGVLRECFMEGRGGKSRSSVAIKTPSRSHFYPHPPPPFPPPHVDSVCVMGDPGCRDPWPGSHGSRRGRAF